MKLISSLLVTLIFCTSTPSFAGEFSNKLSNCMAENTTGKDRKNLVKWIFATTSVHPDLKEITVASNDYRDKANREVASIFTKLMTDTCSSELKLAVKNEGQSNAVAAFKTLGELGMQEIFFKPRCNSVNE